MELVVAIGSAGYRVAESDAHQLIFGYACGMDMTRRDLQLIAREQGRPWDLGKDFEQSAVCSSILPKQALTRSADEEGVLQAGEIQLQVNGETRQSSDLSRLIWDIREILADLSQFYHLQPGDLVYTGTPVGVGPVTTGDHLTGSVAGVGEISLAVGPAE